MSRNELLRKYCQLREAVAETMEETRGTTLARDCFCDDRPHKITDFQDEVFDFIKAGISNHFGLSNSQKFDQKLVDIIEYDRRREDAIKKGNKNG